jgi:hypothetical protein
LSPVRIGFAVLESSVKAFWNPWQWSVSLWLQWIPLYLAITSHQKLSRISIKRLLPRRRF